MWNLHLESFMGKVGHHVIVSTTISRSGLALYEINRYKYKSTRQRSNNFAWEDLSH